ncbi:hypothetical protein [Caballeronia sp. RCC_10]|uniref:hypothetical protein n=1 Tax=Caballeronia sp. RCC_10 TaxID=3239227 RepID=UPI0035269325
MERKVRWHRGTKSSGSVQPERLMFSVEYPPGAHGEAAFPDDGFGRGMRRIPGKRRTSGNERHVPRV